MGILSFTIDSWGQHCNAILTIVVWYIAIFVFNWSIYKVKNNLVMLPVFLVVEKCSSAPAPLSATHAWAVCIDEQYCTERSSIFTRGERSAAQRCCHGCPLFQRPKKLKILPNYLCCRVTSFYCMSVDYYTVHAVTCVDFDFVL